MAISKRQYTEAITVHIKYLRKEMRECLKKSEEARDDFYRVKDAYSLEGLSGYALDAALSDNRDAQRAVANSVLYDRWTTKYAAVLQAELLLFEYNKEVL